MLRAAARPAYTLVELIIVVVLLGIAAAMVAPSIASTDVLRVQSSVRAVVADITFAQSDALARQQGRAIMFDPASNSYSIVEVHGPTLNPASDTILTRSLRSVDRHGDSRLVSAVFDGGSVLVFDELGGTLAAPGGTTPSSGGALVIQGSGGTFTLNVEAYTGRVTVTRNN